MGAIGLACLKPLVPGFHIGKSGPVDLELEIAVELGACRDVAEGEALAGDEGAAFEMLVEQAEENGAARDALPDQVPVSLRFRRSIEVPENAADKDRLEIGQHPVRPHVALRLKAFVGRRERAMAIFVREITDD